MSCILCFNGIFIFILGVNLLLDCGGWYCMVIYDFRNMFRVMRWKIVDLIRWVSSDEEIISSIGMFYWCSEGGMFLIEFLV